MVLRKRERSDRLIRDYGKVQQGKLHALRGRMHCYEFWVAQGELERAQVHQAMHSQKLVNLDTSGPST